MPKGGRVWLLAAFLLTDSVHQIRVPLAPAETLHVELSGVGAPVVLVPGLFGAAFAFRNLVPMVTAAGYEAIVIEPLGIGESSRPERADYSLTAQADRLGAVLDTLQVSHALFIVHSAAGSVGLRLAYRRPDLVAALVSIEGGPAETGGTPALRRALRLATWLRVFGGIRLIRWKIRQVLRASSGDPSWVTDSVIHGYTAAAARDPSATLRALLAIAGARERVALAPHLAEIRCPVVLMIGTVPHEGDVGAAEVALLERTVPRFTLDSVPGTGHFLYEERPEAVMAALRTIAREAEEGGAGDP